MVEGAFKEAHTNYSRLAGRINPPFLVKQTFGKSDISHPPTNNKGCFPSEHEMSYFHFLGTILLLEGMQSLYRIFLPWMVKQSRDYCLDDILVCVEMCVTDGA